MRRVLLSLFIITILFVGCQTGDSEIEDIKYPEVNENQVLYTNNKKGYVGDVVLYKFNTSNYIIDDYQTGYVSKIGETKKRAILPESRKLLKSIDDFANVNYSSTTEFQRQQWESISHLSNNMASVFRAGNNSGGNSGPEQTKFRIFKKFFDDKGNVIYSNYIELDKSTLLKANGKYCTVYYTDELNSSYATTFELGKKLSQSNNNEKNYFDVIAETFDSIYLLETKYFGSNIYTVSDDSKYANTDSKVNIIIMDINQDATEDTSKPITLGFYAPSDLLKSQSKDSSKNEAQILYIDSQALFTNKNMVLSTIVHEFNHLLNDINKVVSGGSSTLAFDTWYTEMLSMLAEDLFAEKLGIPFSSTPNTRLVDFPESYYFGFTTWLPDEDVLYSYANNFAYGSFLVRNYGGVDFLKEIATNNYVGKDSINAALKKLNYKDNFEDTVKEYYKATLNSTSSGKTFNKSIPKNKDGLGFKAMNLEKFATRKSDGSNVDIRPNIVDADVNNQYTLLPTGCTIHYVGTDLDYFVFEKPKSNTMEYDVKVY